MTRRMVMCRFHNRPHLADDECEDVVAAPPQLPCGCVYDVVRTVSATYRDAGVVCESEARTLVRFWRRCSVHAPMCRPLEPWEIDLLGSVNDADQDE